jgi:hypothetical protein
MVGVKVACGAKPSPCCGSLETDGMAIIWTIVPPLFVVAFLFENTYFIDPRGIMEMPSDLLMINGTIAEGAVFLAGDVPFCKIT